MLVAFGVVIDDIVFPEGRTTMNVLGGGGPQAAFGLKLWADSVGLAAKVGGDLPESAWAWLRDSGIDTEGVRVNEAVTPRAWQVTEADGRRTQVWRTPPESVTQPRYTFNQLPDSYQRALGFHFGVHPEEADLQFAAHLRRAGGVVSVSPFRPASQPLPPETLRQLIDMADIFSPNLLDAASLVGPGSPRGLARRLIEAGESRARLIVLRMGESGSLIAEGQTGQVAVVPALRVAVKDSVGAGDAYCGGFLAGWIESHSLITAGLYGSVAASFAVEQVGLPVITADLRAEARRRLAALEPLVEFTSL